MGLKKNLRDSLGAFVLGIAQRKDAGLRERSLVTWQGMSCLKPWQHSKAGILKENLEACAKEELSQYRKSLVALFTAVWVWEIIRGGERPLGSRDVAVCIGPKARLRQVLTRNSNRSGAGELLLNASAARWWTGRA